MHDLLREAFEEAKCGASEGGIPVGAVLIHNGQVIGRGHNRRIQKGSVILHGEMDALENAGRRHPQFYRQSILITTLSPCPMCSGAILLYRIPHVIVGENTTYRGEEELLRQRGVRVDVLNDESCVELMSTFKSQFGSVWNEDIGV